LLDAPHRDLAFFFSSSFSFYPDPKKSFSSLFFVREGSLTSQRKPPYLAKVVAQSISLSLSLSTHTSPIHRRCGVDQPEEEDWVNKIFEKKEKKCNVLPKFAEPGRGQSDDKAGGGCFDLGRPSFFPFWIPFFLFPFYSDKTET
jgi:hypothetical protein